MLKDGNRGGQYLLCPCAAENQSVKMGAFLRQTLLALSMLSLLLVGMIDAQSAIHFSNGYVLCAGQLTPTPPPELSSVAADSEAGYFIVQFQGPVEYSWLKQLAGIGAQSIGYLPTYAAVVRANHAAVDRLKAFDFVTWYGEFPPVAKLQTEVLDLEGTGDLLVVSFPDHSVDSLATVIAKQGIPVTKTAGRVITVAADRAEAARIARLAAVQWVQLATEPCAFNDNVQWVVQTGWQPEVPADSVGRRIWHKGIRGRGIVLSIADSGLYTDHEMFFDPLIPIRDPGIFLHHRKVIAYKVYGVNRFGDVALNDVNYHGTRITGTAAGSDTENGGTGYLDGVAPEARIYFLDVANNFGHYAVDEDMTALFDSVYPGRGTGGHIPQLSLSWGWQQSGARYGIQEATADAAQWHYPDLLTICAAGNSQDQAFYRVRHPGCAKNLLTVGGSGNGVYSDTFADFSSRGPTADHRIKPELIAPAVDIWSTYGTGPQDYVSSSGTSFATTAVNGACALIRQYLTDGWYPDGVPDSSRRVSDPSSALIRALAIVSTDPGISDDAHGVLIVPDSSIGWGRIDLDSTLYFAGDTRKLIFAVNRDGLATGQSREYLVRTDSGMPLRVSLCWTDTAAMPSAETTLVNNLDLELLSPAGQYYHGNRYYLGQSASNPTSWDVVNNTECFRLDRPGSGLWSVRVLARSVFTEHQPYALAVTGDCALLPGVAEGPSSPASGNSIQCDNPVRNSARIRLSLAQRSGTRVAVYDRTGRLAADLCQSQLEPGSHEIIWPLTDAEGQRVTPGIYFVNIQIGTHRFATKLVILR